MHVVSIGRRQFIVPNCPDNLEAVHAVLKTVIDDFRSVRVYAKERKGDDAPLEEHYIFNADIGIACLTVRVEPLAIGNEPIRIR